MVGAQQPLPMGQDPFVQRDRLGCPARLLVSIARLFREARVPG
jgi:hypothetical protein